MKKSLIIAGLAVAALSSAAGSETLLYSNGNWINVVPVNTPSIGATPGSSYRNPAPATNQSGFGDFGWPVDWLPNGTFDGAADDFTIGGPDGTFKMTRLRVYVYESGAANTNNTITGGYVRIWNEKPTGARLTDNSDARIAAGFIGTGADDSDKLLPIEQVVADPLGGDGRSVWSGVYRRGGAYDAATSRPVIALDFDLSDLPSLPGGTYWLEISLVGSTAGTQAWVTSEIVTGSRGLDISGGNYINAAGSGTGQVDNIGRANPRPEVDFAFEIYGTTGGSDRSVAGTVGITEFLGDLAAETFTLELREPGTLNVVESLEVIPASDGTFQVPITSTGAAYDVAIKSSNTLRKKLENVSFGAEGVGGLEFLGLRAGDADNSNFVDLDDYFTLADSFRLSEGDSGFNPEADFNGDGTVDLDDYFILADSFRTGGDE